MIVSVLMPMRNSEQFVADAIESVLSSNAEESRFRIEIIVVDDNSSDSSLDVVRRLGDDRIKIVHGAGKGVASALNLAYEQSKGQIIMRCDSDDLYIHSKIVDQVIFLENNPDCVAVCGRMNYLTQSGVLLEPSIPLGTCVIDISHDLIRGELSSSLCTFAIRRGAFEQAGRFREYFKTSEDLDFAFRLGAVGRVVFVDRSWYTYRIHSESITHKSKNGERLFFEMQAKSFSLQRLRDGYDSLELGVAENYKGDGSGVLNCAEDHEMLLAQSTVWALYSQGNFTRSFFLSMRLFLHHPFRLAYLKTTVALVVKFTRSRR